MAVGCRPPAWPPWELGTGPWELRSAGGIEGGTGTLTTVRGSVTVPLARASPRLATLSTEHSALSTRAVGCRPIGVATLGTGLWELGTAKLFPAAERNRGGVSHGRAVWPPLPTDRSTPRNVGQRRECTEKFRVRPGNAALLFAPQTGK